MFVFQVLELCNAGLTGNYSFAEIGQIVSISIIRCIVLELL